MSCNNLKNLFAIESFQWQKKNCGDVIKMNWVFTLKQKWWITSWQIYVSMTTDLINRDVIVTFNRVCLGQIELLIDNVK